MVDSYIACDVTIGLIMLEQCNTSFIKKEINVRSQSGPGSEE